MWDVDRSCFIGAYKKALPCLIFSSAIISSWSLQPFRVAVINLYLSALDQLRGLSCFVQALSEVIQFYFLILRSFSTTIFASVHSHKSIRLCVHYLMIAKVKSTSCKASVRIVEKWGSDRSCEGAGMWRGVYAENAAVRVWRGLKTAAVRSRKKWADLGDRLLLGVRLGLLLTSPYCFCEFETERLLLLVWAFFIRSLL